MQSSTCQLCGQVLVSSSVVIPADKFVAAELAIHLIDLPELDQLAGRMVMHIHERHPEEARKMALVSFAASKVFAMTHAESAEEDFSSLRRKWRKALIEMIGAQPTGQSETETPVPSEAPRA